MKGQCSIGAGDGGVYACCHGCRGVAACLDAYYIDRCVRAGCVVMKNTMVAVYCQQSALGHGVRVRMGRRYVVFNVNTNGARRCIAEIVRHCVVEGIGV